GVVRVVSAFVAARGGACGGVAAGVDDHGPAAADVVIPEDVDRRVLVLVRGRRVVDRIRDHGDLEGHLAARVVGRVHVAGRKTVVLEPTIVVGLDLDVGDADLPG